MRLTLRQTEVLSFLYLIRGKDVQGFDLRSGRLRKGPFEKGWFCFDADAFAFTFKCETCKTRRRAMRTKRSPRQDLNPKVPESVMERLRKEGLVEPHAWQSKLWRITRLGVLRLSDPRAWIVNGVLER